MSNLFINPKNISMFIAAVIIGASTQPAYSQYGYERLRPTYGTDINGNQSYRDSNGTTYKHSPTYDPGGYGSYKLRGNDGTTLTCRRGYSRDTCD